MAYEHRVSRVRPAMPTITRKLPVRDSIPDADPAVLKARRRVNRPVSTLRGNMKRHGGG
jgi:hypothetical protein